MWTKRIWFLFIEMKVSSILYLKCLFNNLFHIYTYKHVFTRKHLDISKHKYTHTTRFTRKHTFIPIKINVCIHTLTNNLWYLQLSMGTHRREHISINTLMHIKTNIHKYDHMYSKHFTHINPHIESPIMDRFTRRHTLSYP